jgi:hypothetical protein
VTGILLLLIGVAASAPAQENTSDLRGRAVDAQQAVLPGVTITVTNQATGVYRESVTNPDGTYFISGLQPGLYSLSAALEGFKKYSRRDVRLDLGKTTTLDLTLEVGNLTEAVTVTAQTPLVDVTSKEIGGNVTSREMVSLPSVNGNFVGMVALLPGIIANVSTESFGADAVSVNGMDSRNNNYMLDGANNNDDVIGQRAGSQGRVPLEAVAEFQVVTNQYDAEFGRTTGAIINAISKQGSNEFHGMAGGLFQNPSWTAKDFFVKQNGLDKPETKQQTYRANIGGPIVRDKAHFFFNLERVMVDRPNTISIASHPELNGAPVTTDRVWNTLARFDHQLNVNHTWGVRWLRESSPQLNQIIGVGALQATQAASREENDVDQTIVGTLNSSIGHNRLNTLRLNFTQEDVAFGNPAFNSNGQDQAALKPQLNYLTFVDQQNATAQARVDNAYELDDTLSWFIPNKHGDHDVKFGFQYEFVGAQSTAQDNLNGTFTFRSDEFFNPADPRTYPERLSVRVPGALNRYQKAHFWTAFAQDKWRVSNRATLSLGLRYDVENQPLVESNNFLFSDPNEHPLDLNNFGPRVGLTYDISGNGTGVFRGGYGRFYDKTHFELISAILTAGVFSDSFTAQFPTNSADPGPAAGRLPTDPMLANGPIVNRSLLAQLFPPGSLLKNNGTVTLDNPDRTIPHTDQFTAGYEHQLNPNLSLSTDYVHARGRELLMLQDLNYGLRTSTARTATLVRNLSPIASQFVAAVNEPMNVGEIDYDALEIGLVKRFSQNYQYRVSYTLGYGRGNTSGAGIPTSTFQLLDNMNLEANRGPVNVDRRHNLVISGLALVPHTHGLNLSWVARALSGSPFSLTDSNLDPDRNGQFQEPLAAGDYTNPTAENPFPVTADATRNGARGPGFFQLDMRLGYLINLRQARRLNLFLDIFNVTNRANFDNPTGDRRSTDFLNLVGLRAGAVPTTVQLAARFEF